MPETPEQISYIKIGNYEHPIDAITLEGKTKNDFCSLQEVLQILTDYQRKPVVIYETDGTTGLLGHNNNGYDGNWQLEDLDLTPYKYIKCYFKATTLTDANTYTPAVIVIVQLDAAAKGTTIYSGSVIVPLPFNRNRQYLISCAVDGTKTKFQVIHQNTLWDITASDANNNGRYLYKIEGYYD